MSIIGKLVGGAIGFALGGPIGAIAGAVFGHAFDNKPADSDTAMNLSYGESSQITFFVATFSIRRRNLPNPLRVLPPSSTGSSMFNPRCWS